MDKINPAKYNVKSRGGFALLITISVLMVLIALTVVLLSYFQKVKQDASDTTAMIQADVYYADITEIFSRFKKKEQLFATLYQFPVPIVSPDGRFSMLLRCNALSRGVNVNWLGLEESSDMQEAYAFAQEIFDTLAQEYSLEDPTRLREMILEEIGGQAPYIKKEFSRLRQKKGIISYEQFAQIISRYQLEVDDPDASRVPWQKYFTFSENATVIDAAYSSPELLALLFDIDLQSVKEWYNDPYKGSLQSFVENNGGDYAARKNIIADKTFLEESECSVSFKSAMRAYKFRFEYIQGEAKRFEFYEG